MNDETQAAPAEGEVAPVETEQPAEVEQTEETATSDEQQTEETEGNEKPRRKRGAERRIAQLTRKTHELEAQLQALQQPQNPTQEAAKEPRREDFDSFEEFLRADANYQVDQRLAQEREESQKRETETAQQRQAQEIAERRDDLVDAGVDAYADFEEVAGDPDLQITDVMRDAILESATGHDIWYHLGQHPQKAEKIANLSPINQAREIGLLEASLKVSKKPSNAPPPPKPVGTRNEATNALRDDLSTEEWIKRRTKQLRG